MFSGCLQDFSRMFSVCSDGSCGPGGIWWSFQVKVWTLMTQSNSMIPSYSMIPAIWWSPATRWSPAIRWSIGCVDFDSPKVYGDTFISDGLVSYWTRHDHFYLQLYTQFVIIHNTCQFTHNVRFCTQGVSKIILKRRILQHQYYLRTQHNALKVCTTVCFHHCNLSKEKSALL